MTAEPAGDEEPKPGSAKHPVRKALWRVFLVLAMVFVVEYLVLPQVAGARKALGLVSHVNLGLVALAVALEAASLTCYAQLTRSVLPRHSGLSIRTTLEIDLTTLAISHVVPGGAAVAAGTGFHLLTDQGIQRSDAGFALATQGLGSAAVLNLLLWLGLLVSIPLRGFNPLYGTAAVAGVILIGGFSVAIILLVRGEERAATAIRAVARKVPFLNEESMDRVVHRLAQRLKDLGSDPRMLSAAFGWAAANWVLDMGCLSVFLLAFGYRVPVDGLVVSYGLANVVAAIPLTPGGLGVLEAVLTSSLVAFGAPRGVAILGVLGYRLVNFWLPIPVGGLSYLALRVEGEPSEELKAQRLKAQGIGALAAEATREREPPGKWAERHGVQLPPKGGGRRPTDNPS